MKLNVILLESVLYNKNKNRDNALMKARKWWHYKHHR